jgi:hypothetical protein
MLDAANTQIPSSRVPVVDKLGQLMERSWYRFFTNLYNYFISLPFGSFYDTTNQTAAANTPTAITFNSTGITRNIAVGTPTSRIVFNANGSVSLTFSLQFTNSSASEDDVYVWLRKNGADSAATASTITVPKKHGAIDGAAILTVNFFEEYEAGDYLQLYWLTVGGVSQLTTVAATTSPAKPASPSVVLTVGEII